MPNREDNCAERQTKTDADPVHAARSHPARPAPAPPALAPVLAKWGLQYWGRRPDLAIAGSPERSALRRVVETADGRLLVLEKIPAGSHARKLRIAETVAALEAGGLGQVLPYLRTPEGELLPRAGDGHWQLLPFVPGEPLPRPAHAFQAWRGRALAEFLCELRQVSGRCAGPAAGDGYSVSDYARRLAMQIRRRASAFYPKIERAVAHVAAKLDDGEACVPTAFCHGDFHPLNVLWAKRGIRAVIDWEFCGVKTEMYDAALLLGCLGFEDPDALVGDCAMTFVGHLREHADFAPASWRLLVDLVIAVRFGWLAEWFRHRDRAARTLEAVYLELLLDHREQLRQAWCPATPA